MDQALYDRIMELQSLSLFRTATDDGQDAIVNSPRLNLPVATAFERIARFADPAVEVGRLGVHEVHHACFGFDAVEDGLDGLSLFPRWLREGAVNVRRMSGGRC